MTAVDERLRTVRFETDEQGHIRIDGRLCGGCAHQACVSVCPAGRYRPTPSGVEHSHVGCIECGACEIACDRGAIDWHYPTGGKGVAFRYG